MSALFSKPKQSKIPDSSSKDIEEERRRQLAARKRAGGRSSTILTGGAGVTSPVLGAATSLIGGV